MRSAGGTDFKSDDVELQLVLDEARVGRIRLKVIYDGAYGRMGESHDFGYVGRSMGNPKFPNGGVKAPLLIHNSRSTGGEVLCDDHIIKVQTSRNGRVLWTRKG